MRNTIKLLVFSGFFYLPGVQGLDLAGIYEMARENDPQIRQVREQVNSVRESRPQAKALLLPNLSVGGGYDLVNQDVSRSLTGSRDESFDQWEQPVRAGYEAMSVALEEHGGEIGL